MADSERIKGEIERVSYYNDDTGFAVLSLRVPGQRENMTVVGRSASAAVGEIVDATGHWHVDKRYGRQFRADQLQVYPPTTAEGMLRYLSSGSIPGIGPKLAERMITSFGDKLLDIMEHHSDLLLQVRGIGKKKLDQINAAWRQTREIRQIMLFLTSHGVGTSRAFRIYRRYGSDAIPIIRENPYRLADDIWGIGFKTADELAQRLGIDAQSPKRAMAAVVYVLQSSSHEGHCAMPLDEVVQRTAELTEIEQTTIEAAVRSLVSAERVVADVADGQNWLWLPGLHRAEWGIAEAIHRLGHARRHPLAGIKVERAIEWVQQKLSIELAPDQHRAVREALRQQVLVITGGPGVGKTTIVRSIVEIFSAKELKCVLAAPTGRAAKRLEEATGRPAKTIHRLLEFSPQTGRFQRGPEQPLNGDLFVLDEASMLDVPLACSFLQALPPHACLVMVGDVDQLPSVGPGSVLSDLIESECVPVVRLTTIFRQQNQSQIVTAAHCINGGQLPSLRPPGAELGEFYFIRAEEPQQITERVVQLVRDRIPQRFGLDPRHDIQVLVPMNRSAIGAHQLNHLLQAELNPSAATNAVERFGWKFAPGDRVIQLSNNYDRNVFNGDQGIILEVNRVDQTVLVEFDNRRLSYDFHSLDELALSYALTVHKSQGSEYPCVIIPLHTQHYLLLQRNLLYTAVTRGKQLVVIVGSLRAIRLAVQRCDMNKRYSALLQRLHSVAERSAAKPYG